MWIIVIIVFWRKSIWDKSQNIDIYSIIYIIDSQIKEGELKVLKTPVTLFVFFYLLGCSFAPTKKPQVLKFEDIEEITKLSRHQFVALMNDEIIIYPDDMFERDVYVRLKQTDTKKWCEMWVVNRGDKAPSIPHFERQPVKEGKIYYTRFSIGNREKEAAFTTIVGPLGNIFLGAEKTPSCYILTMNNS